MTNILKIKVKTPVLQGKKPNFICRMARFMRRARKMAERLKIVKDDPWLEPVEGELEYRRKAYLMP